MILKHMLNYQAALDRSFHALADPARRTMVERLTRGPASVSELAGPLAMSLPAVMQHLGVLMESGLVKSQKKGRVRICELDAKAMADAEAWFRNRRELWERRLDRLADYLDEENAKRKKT
jgi:DNA-binding transcriptional ArsR family regulator